MFSAASARADSYTFFSMTNNRSGDAAVGEAQLRMEVEAVGTGQVRFTFTNLGPGPSSITDVILG